MVRGRLIRKKNMRFLVHNVLVVLREFARRRVESPPFASTRARAQALVDGSVKVLNYLFSRQRDE